MTKNKLIGVLTRMVNTQLPEYINACLSVDNAYVRLLNGSKDNLYGTVSSIKGLVLIDNRYVAVLGVYLSNGVNEVVVPLQKELDKCDIISGKVCQVDTITNYINRGGGFFLVLLL